MPRTELYTRSGDISKARESYGRALRLTSIEPERRFLLRKLRQCGHAAP
jgi:predicted RNA polymerase sigma factor